jgi:hypothetical protein
MQLCRAIIIIIRIREEKFVDLFIYTNMKKHFIIPFLALLIAAGCKNKDTSANTSTTTGGNTIPPVTSVLGYNLLKKVKGIWNGPVTSTTPLGGYPEWIVDFRPISENQVSAKNELDTLNDIHMSFFIALYNNQYKVAFRNGGSFAGMKRVAYFLADSVSESASKSFYRFSEIIKGKSRAYTEVIFIADSLIIKSYTNNKNTQTYTTPHMTWKAKLQDSTSCQAAVSNFGFPKMTMTKNFSSSFTGLTEAIFYSASGDPYPESAQPYLGQTTFNYTYAGGYTPVAGKKVFLIVTTQPLFSGPVFLSTNLKYRSRYVILTVPDMSYVFNYMHPGTYYTYAFYDTDGNMAPNTGYWISTANSTFTLTNQGTATAAAQINFTIP